MGRIPPKRHTLPLRVRGSRRERTVLGSRCEMTQPGQPTEITPDPEEEEPPKATPARPPKPSWAPPDNDPHGVVDPTMRLIPAHPSASPAPPAAPAPPVTPPGWEPTDVDATMRLIPAHPPASPAPPVTPPAREPTDVEATMRQVLSFHPLRRIGTPRDIFPSSRLPEKSRTMATSTR